MNVIKQNAFEIRQMFSRLGQRVKNSKLDYTLLN